MKGVQIPTEGYSEGHMYVFRFVYLSFCSRKEEGWSLFGPGSSLHENTGATRYGDTKQNGKHWRHQFSDWTSLDISRESLYMMKGGTRTTPPPSVNRMTHRYNRKHYLAAILLAGVIMSRGWLNITSNWLKFKNQIKLALFVLSSTIYFKVNPASVVWFKRTLAEIVQKRLYFNRIIINKFKWHFRGIK